MRLRPTKIELTPRDLEWHGQRLQQRMYTNEPGPTKSQGKTLFTFQFPDNQKSTAPPFQLPLLRTSSEDSTNSSKPIKKGKAPVKSSQADLGEEKATAGTEKSTVKEPVIGVSLSSGFPHSHSRNELSLDQSNPSALNVAYKQEVSAEEYVPTALQFGPSLNLLSGQDALSGDFERLQIDSEEMGRDELATRAPILNRTPQQNSLASGEFAAPSNSQPLSSSSPTPRNASWDFSLPSSPPVPRYSSPSFRTVTFESSPGTSFSPAASYFETSHPSDLPLASTSFAASSLPSSSPHTPPRSDIRVYNDSLPSQSQPQTPLGLPRHGIAAASWTGMYTTPRASTFAGMGESDSLYFTPTRRRAGATRSYWRQPSDAAPGDGAVDQENAARYAESDRRRQIIREQRLGYGTGNTEELDRTPPREPRRRPWE